MGWDVSPAYDVPDPPRLFSPLFIVWIPRRSHVTVINMPNDLFYDNTEYDKLSRQVKELRVTLTDLGFMFIHEDLI